MTKNELCTFLENNTNIECHSDNDYFYFRNNSLPWYANHSGNCTRFTRKLVEDLSPDQLLKEINRGLEVEGITRITGYYSKTTKWNKGKLGELRERTRNNAL